MGQTLVLPWGNKYPLANYPVSTDSPRFARRPTSLEVDMVLLQLRDFVRVQLATGRFGDELSETTPEK